jgi:hypothetical protein
VGSNTYGNNAFFVRNDLVEDNFVVKDISKIYKPSKWGYKPINKDIMKLVN